MSSPEIVVTRLKAHLQSVGVTYAVLARRLRLSESSVKRMFSLKDMTLVRLASICRVAGIAMEDILRDAADAAPRLEALTLAQERALTADLRLFLVAVCCLNQWSLAQITETYDITELQCVRHFAQLDRLGLIVLKPGNTYRLNVSPAFHWRADGPAFQMLRSQVAPDFLSGNFDGDSEVMLCVPTRLAPESAAKVVALLQELSGKLAQFHQQDRRREAVVLDGYTLLAGFRSWEFSGFTSMRRKQNSEAAAARAGPPGSRSPSSRAK